MKKEKIKLVLNQIKAFKDALEPGTDIRLGVKGKVIELIVYKTEDRKTKYIDDIDLDVFNELLSIYLQNHKNKIFKYIIANLKQEAALIKEDAIKELSKELEDLNKI